MPDATRLDWLVEYADVNDKLVYERFGNVNDAIPFLHEVLSKSQRPRLYRETPITLTIDVGGEAPVKSPRRRRKKEAKDSTDAPGKGHTPADDGGASAGGPVLQTGPDGCQSPEENRATESGDASDGEKDGAPKPESAPVFPWTCEANFDGDPKCPGPVMWDHVTCGWFCGLHLTAIPPSGRVELHRKHASRNRPVRVAHAL